MKEGVAEPVEPGGDVVVEGIKAEGGGHAAVLAVGRMTGDAELLEVILTRRPVRRGADLHDADGNEADEDGNDGEGDQEFDEGEGTAPRMASHVCLLVNEERVLFWAQL